MTSERGPLPDFLAPLSWTAARFYGMGASFVHRRHRLRGGTRVPVPVISVGNLSVGGTGKTPFTRRVAEAIIAAGGKPAIALRGYRSRATNGSDEAREYQESLPGVPVLVGADRASVILGALESAPGTFDCVVLDDGFQHRRLHRDLDIVLIDSSRSDVFGDLLPNGWLRESVTALGRADCVVLTNHLENCGSPAFDRLAGKHSENAPVVRCRHGWSEVLHHDSTSTHALSVARASSRFPNVLVITGLGNPDAMIKSVQDHGFSITQHLRHRDHAAYTESDGRAFLQRGSSSDAILVSAKDWVKLRELSCFQTSTTPILVPQVRIEFSSGEFELAGLLSKACGRRIAL
ncbi:MAG TPA: tetraacyldisaccharide 4'-kinase [Phycisphaerales bacterium]|nr:tetraacyldisaccharide 4'-kinase [Phycisphaerales bacterium]